MTKLIAETAWHHEGDFSFMKNLVTKICSDSSADIVKLHILLDLDEYMTEDHDAYDVLKKWMLSRTQWSELIGIIKNSGKDLMLLLNDTAAVEFASKFSPEYVELHSVCVNVPAIQDSLLINIDECSKVMIGVGGCSLQEIDKALNVFSDRETVLMFGFQNYPTKYKNVNLKKIRKIQLLYCDKQFGYADHTAWNEDNNELITLLVASNGMDYIEKHITTHCGEKRCDYSAAVSIEKFNQISDKIKVLDDVYGDGLIILNSGERDYSKFGPMKMAALMKCDVNVGQKLSNDNFSFFRTSQQTKMSQIDVLDKIGTKFKSSIKKNKVIDWKYFE